MRRTIRLPEVSIATPRLVLRGLAKSDFDDLVAEVNDFAVTRMLARIPYPYSRADAEGFLASTGRDTSDLALMITGEGRVIGGIGLARIDRDCEFGYWLGRRHWGKGYATEAAHAFLAHAYASLPIDAIHSGVFVDNPASLRVQEKLGFRQTGRRFVECLVRRCKVEHIDTVLTRAVFEETRP
jgi:RimJ/RimL family protein N-acetyltransferase